MGRVRERGGYLFFDFRYLGERYREQTKLKDTPANRKRLEKIMGQIEADILQGALDFGRYFPDRGQIEKVKAKLPVSESRADEGVLGDGSTPTFKAFAEEWLLENEVRWKRSYCKTVRGNLDKHLIPEFGEKKVGSITKGEILKFRSSLAKVRNGKKDGLSPDRINHIMTTLRMILEDAADRHNFSTPFTRIKPLRVLRSDVDPFSMEEVGLFLEKIRADFRDYYTVRFFTGMRTGEIDGLKWIYVDFERRLIRVRETLVDGREDVTKTPGSIREIAMSTPVFEAISRQYELTGKLGPYVFCNREGLPLDHRNVTKRIWYPSLRLMGIKARKPYQTRHTAATLWLASGENPEWIARQMGHTSTRMLFTIYSRFVPNLTRQDGSAIERLLITRIPGGAHD